LLQRHHAEAPSGLASNLEQQAADAAQSEEDHHSSRSSANSGRLRQLQEEHTQKLAEIARQRQTAAEMAQLAGGNEEDAVDFHEGANLLLPADVPCLPLRMEPVPSSGYVTAYVVPGDPRAHEMVQLQRAPSQEPDVASARSAYQDLEEHFGAFAHSGPAGGVAELLGSSRGSGGPGSDFPDVPEDRPLNEALENDSLASIPQVLAEDEPLGGWQASDAPPQSAPLGNPTVPEMETSPKGVLGDDVVEHMSRSGSSDSDVDSQAHVQYASKPPPKDPPPRRLQSVERPMVGYGATGVGLPKPAAPGSAEAPSVPFAPSDSRLAQAPELPPPPLAVTLPAPSAPLVMEGFSAAPTTLEEGTPAPSRPTTVDRSKAGRLRSLNPFRRRRTSESAEPRPRSTSRPRSGSPFRNPAGPTEVLPLGTEIASSSQQRSDDPAGLVFVRGAAHRDASGSRVSPEDGEL